MTAKEFRAHWGDRAHLATGASNHPLDGPRASASVAVIPDKDFVFFWDEEPAEQYANRKPLVGSSIAVLAAASAQLADNEVTLEAEELAIERAHRDALTMVERMRELGVGLLPIPLTSA